MKALGAPAQSGIEKRLDELTHVCVNSLGLHSSLQSLIPDRASRLNFPAEHIAASFVIELADFFAIVRSIVMRQPDASFRLAYLR